MTRPASDHRDGLMDELRLLALKWRRFQQDRREQRELYRTLGWTDKVAVAYTEGYFAGLFASDLERLIQRFEGGGANRGA